MRHPGLMTDKKQSSVPVWLVSVALAGVFVLKLIVLLQLRDHPLLHARTEPGRYACEAAGGAPVSCSAFSIRHSAFCGAGVRHSPFDIRHFAAPPAYNPRRRLLMTARALLGRVLLSILVGLLLLPAATVRTQGGVDKSLYLSVLDASGKPVKDMVADDILIREDGVDRQVV